MFCTNCGARLEDGAKFCTSCGTPTGEGAAPAQTPASVPAPEPAPAERTAPSDAGAAAPESPNAAPPAPPKKRKLLIPIIAAAVVVVAAAAALCFPALANFASKTFSKPDDYYHKVEMKTVNGVVESVGNYYGLLMDSAGRVEDFGASGSLELSAGKALNKLLQDADMEDELGWVSTVRADFNINRNDREAGGDLALKLNKDKLATINFFLNMDEGAFYAQIPEVSKNYLTVSTDDMGDMSYMLYSLPYSLRSVLSSVSSMDAEQGEQIAAVIAALPTQAQVEALLEKYLGIVVDSIEDVEKGSGTLTAGEVSAKYTTLEVEIDLDTATAIAQNLIKELKQDKEIKKYLTDIAGALEQDGDEVYERFLDSLENAEENLERSAERGSDEKLEMTLYVDGRGNIAGREIRFGDGKLKYAMVSKGGKGGLELSMKQSGSTVFSLAGDGKLSGTSINGELALKVEGDSVATITLEKINATKLKKGFLDGSITVKPSRQALENLYLPSSVESIARKLSLTLTFDTAQNKSDVKLIVNQDSDQLATLAISAKTGASGKITAVKDGYEPEEWAENLKESDLKAFIKDLKKTDIPKDYIESLEDTLERLY